MENLVIAAFVTEEHLKVKWVPFTKIMGARIFPIMRCVYVNAFKTLLTIKNL